MSASPTNDDFRDGFPFMGGRPWLDLLNTTPLTETGPRDLLGEPHSMAAWLAAAGLGEAATPETGFELKSLRETLRPTFDLLRQGKPLPEGSIDAINRLLVPATERYQLQRGDEGYALISVADRGVGAAWRISLDFARFVCDHEPARLKHCANHDCVMVFYDRGRNNTRRWCTMSTCGNRDKVARFRARKSQ
ncbi:CGNR zinc finger domain-containing protein [Bosea sp. 2RAB26]|uniref:CGNR zinc finger domain-containing protein n=1 Tax=Bosea sp. 2RAB26 TaxID=3237476 RepID=UPI003F8F73D4